jgi:hypothetical protein
MASKLVKPPLMALLLITAACMWHLPLAGPGESAQYASLTPPPDQALLYVLRADEVEGGGIMSLVRLDGENFGVVRGGTYLVAALPPGRHTLSSTLDKTAELELSLRAGQTYYVKHRVLVQNTVRRPGLESMEAQQGRALISGYRMSQKNWLLDTVK